MRTYLMATLLILLICESIYILMSLSQTSSNSICNDCDKKNQKDLPSNSLNSSSPGMPCEQSYHQVSHCMRANKGLVSDCAMEWEIFKKCHEKYRDST
jgi:hypothetical protein